MLPIPQISLSSLQFTLNTSIPLCLQIPPSLPQHHLEQLLLPPPSVGLDCLLSFPCISSTSEPEKLLGRGRLVVGVTVVNSAPPETTQLGINLSKHLPRPDYSPNFISLHSITVCVSQTESLSIFPPSRYNFTLCSSGRRSSPSERNTLPNGSLILLHLHFESWQPDPERAMLMSECAKDGAHSSSLHYHAPTWLALRRAKEGTS